MAAEHEYEKRVPLNPNRRIDRGVWLCVLYRLITSVLFLQFLSYTAFTTNEVMETMGAVAVFKCMLMSFPYSHDDQCEFSVLHPRKFDE
ncbi:hypothetical protein NC652_012632 [Populus alba x Populus x berolinensis]|nr:hypothetical protein NC652_012632 [Populus alba x Populus x berolinensis]